MAHLAARRVESLGLRPVEPSSPGPESTPPPTPLHTLKRFIRRSRIAQQRPAAGTGAKSADHSGFITASDPRRVAGRNSRGLSSLAPAAEPECQRVLLAHPRAGQRPSISARGPDFFRWRTGRQPDCPAKIPLPSPPLSPKTTVGRSAQPGSSGAAA